MRAGHQADAWRRVLGLRGGLVAGQVTVAVVLAVGAGLLGRSYLTQLRWNPGFDRGHLLTFWTFASTGRYPDAERVSALFVRVEQEIRTVPGVTAVGMASSGPLFGGEETGEFQRVGADPAQAPMSARWYDMSPSYFPALGVPLERGRLFSESDGPGAPRVVLINETMARRYFGGIDPIGQRIVYRRLSEPMEIVGVVGDIAPFTPGEAAAPEVYWPYRQEPRWASSFVVRTSGDPRLVARTVAARMAAIDPDLSPSQVRTMDELVTRKVARTRFQMLLIGVFAVLAVALSLVGVYGVVTASVAARTREFGVRMAIGATPKSVLTMVLREGVALTVMGLLAGTLVAAGLSRLVAALTPGVRSTDPLTYAAIALLVGAASVLACLVPAVRATRVHPMETLRAE
jgi:putative ABC transport system permease protein